MKKINVNLIKTNIDEYWKKHHRFFRDLKLYTLFFKHKNNDYFLMRNQKKDGAIILIDSFLANATSAMDCIKRCHLTYNNEAGFAEFEKKVSPYYAIVKPFDGELPSIYNAGSQIYHDINEPFTLISYVAAGYTREPINPNLISSWGYSFNYDIL